MKQNYFIIVNYNDYDNTNKLIENIKDYKCIKKIIVVDNNSTDNSVEKLEKIKLKNLELLKLNNNKGYGSAINYACDYIKGLTDNANLIISNSDIRIEKEEDLKKLVDNIKDDIVVSAPVINTNGILSFGWRLTFIKDEIITNLPIIGKKYYDKKVLNNSELDLNNKKVTEVVSGCFFAIDLNTLYSNKFDENIFLYYEENILAHKLKQKGLKSIIDGNITIYHEHSKTIDKNLNDYKKLKILKESQYYFYKNVMKSSNILLVLLNIEIKLILLIKKLKVGTKN